MPILEVSLRAPRTPLPTAWLTVLAAVLAAVLLLVALRVLDQSPPTPRPTPAVSAPTLRPPVPVLAAARGGSPPAQAAVARTLAAAVADPAFNGRLAGIVLGADSKPRFAAAADALLPPASTAKLATAVAALSTLGDDARLGTLVQRRGTGVVLVGGGDTTLASPAAVRTTPGLASLDALAATTASKLRAAGTRAVTVAYDTSRYSGPTLGPGWKPGYLTGGDVAPVTALMVDGGRVRPDREARHAQPAAAAARAFGARLAARGVAVQGAPQPVAARSPAGPELARVSSPPIGDLVARMLTDSDNTLAEALGREVARRAGLPGSFAGAAEGIRRTVETLGISSAGLRLVDASGLSSLNRATPAALAGLLAAAATRPGLHGLFAGLPVAGFSGTLLDRFRTGPAAAAAGVVRAKTGSLSGVSALAGIVVARSGALLTFAFLAPALAPALAQDALDRLAAALARL